MIGYSDPANSYTGASWFGLPRREVAPAGLLDSLPSEVALDSHGEEHEEQYAER